MKVQIGVPTGNASISSGTAQSIMDALKKSHHEIDVEIVGLSLLARCFNTLFKSAYDRGVDYFFLLHSDIQLALPPYVQPFSNIDIRWGDAPTNCWLDLMIYRMQQYKLAALAGPALIKSDAGFLSAGLDMYKGDYHRLRRMTLTELQLCPNKMLLRLDACLAMGFDPDVAGAFLINSGSLLMDMSFPWFYGDRPWPGFGIEDELVCNSHGELALATQSEDWRFSRWMHENNVPYGMTKEIVVLHHGHRAFSSFDMFGCAKDESPFDISPLDFKTT